MKVLVVFGSPRKDGNTKNLLIGFLSGLPRETQVEIVYAYDLNPTPCTCCGYCTVADGCSKKDLEPFWQKFREADVIVFATPVYNYTFPAPLKALFDRFQRYYNARFVRNINNSFLKERKAILLVTSGCDGKFGYEVIKKQAESAFSVLNIKLYADILVGNTDEKPVGELDVCKAKYLATSLAKEYK